MRNSIHDLLRESKSGIHQRKGYHRSHPNEKHSGIDPGAYHPDEKSAGKRRQYIPRTDQRGGNLCRYMSRLRICSHTPLHDRGDV